MQPWSPSGLDAVPHLRWGSHLAHVFSSGDELGNLLVPYFKAGLENGEQCLWVTGNPFDAAQARAALGAAVPDLAVRERSGQIEIVDASTWYDPGEKLRPRELVDGLVQRAEDALALGYAGLRTNGNCAWVSAAQWDDFLDYEQQVQEAVRGRRMICLCSYCTDQLHDGAHGEMIGRHDMAIAGAAGGPAPRPRANGHAHADALREDLARQKRTFDLAMTASQMGTWRYTMADNICVYDENAQRLYGLDQPRFLHDEAGVRAKFHPDDVPVMWAQVAAALDPAGDGRYTVEYRVRQRDGSWRWLSAWGLIEYEGEGADRKAVAMVGASRDLTERKQTEDLQRLLLNELSHRVKNTLATIQAIAVQTLNGAADLPSARRALDRRIGSMARAHDLLTTRGWTDANLAEVVARALDAFAPGQVTVSGAAIDITPRQTLALSMALHELATNATKYGALSMSAGKVDVAWAVRDRQLRLSWVESGGPPVAPPTRKGFGSQLLERLLVRDLGGLVELDYDPAGLRFALTIPINADASAEADPGDAREPEAAAADFPIDPFEVGRHYEVG